MLQQEVLRSWEGRVVWFRSVGLERHPENWYGRCKGLALGASCMVWMLRIVRCLICFGCFAQVGYCCFVPCRFGFFGASHGRCKGLALGASFGLGKLLGGLRGMVWMLRIVGCLICFGCFTQMWHCCIVCCMLVFFGASHVRCKGLALALVVIREGCPGS